MYVIDPTLLSDKELTLARTEQENLVYRLKKVKRFNPLIGRQIAEAEERYILLDRTYRERGLQNLEE